MSSKPVNASESRNYASSIVPIVLVLITIAGALIAGLGAYSIFGPIASPGFYASVIGGGVTALLSSTILFYSLCSKVRSKDNSHCNRGNKTLESGNSVLNNNNMERKSKKSLDSKEDLIVYFKNLTKIIKNSPSDATKSVDDKPIDDSTMSFVIHHTEIFPGVYLGNFKAYFSIDANYQELLNNEVTDYISEPTEEQRKYFHENRDVEGCLNKNIKQIVSAAKMPKFNPDQEQNWRNFNPEFSEEIEQVKIEQDDTQDFWPSITDEQLEKIFGMIDKAIQGKDRNNILVHCMEGKSRSPTIICAYLLSRCEDLTVDEAINYVASKREILIKECHKKALEENRERLKRFSLNSKKAYFKELGQKIRGTPQYKPDERVGVFTSDFVSLFTHQHQILPGVFLGDYRAYLSTDPEFVKKFEDALVDSAAAIFEGAVTAENKEWAKENLDNKGCSDKNIKQIVSVTQFQSNVKEEEDDWSKFQPNLSDRERVQIKVDDTDHFWEKISADDLEKAFKMIDQAIEGEGQNNVLVHCVMGASRSASIIYAYLMNRCGVTLDQAFNYVQSIRHQVELKSATRADLEEYSESLNQNN